MQDSVFSEYLIQYFPDDQPVTSERKIKSELDKIENPSANLFSKTFDSAIDNAVTFLREAILRNDQESIKKYKWNLNITLSNNLYAEWLLGLKKGKEHGQDEINLLSRRNRKQNYSAPSNNNLIYFAQPEAESAIIRNRPAERAIMSRVNTLASDVSNSEWTEIRNTILQAIRPQSATEDPISRQELLDRINAQLGDRKDRYRNRAQNIARTELTFAYNAGRLDSYVRSGLVEAVRFQSIFDDRRCIICESRQGIIVRLDDIESLARLVIPVHPSCRCVWSPVLLSEYDQAIKDEKRLIENRKILSSKTWKAGAIIAALLIPEELFTAGLLTVGFKNLISRVGSTTAARTFIARKINEIGNKDITDIKEVAIAKKTSTKKYVKTGKVQPLIVTNGFDLQTVTANELAQIIPTLSITKAKEIIRLRKQKLKFNDFEDLKPYLNSYQYLKLKEIAKKNYLLTILHPNNNITASSIWVNSGGIISKANSKKIFKLIKSNQYSSVEELLNDLRKNGVDAENLNTYAETLFDNKINKNKS